MKRLKVGMLGLAILVVASFPGAARGEDCASSTNLEPPALKYTTETATAELLVDRACTEIAWGQSLGAVTMRLRLSDDSWDNYKQTRIVCPQEEVLCRASVTVTHPSLEVPWNQYHILVIVESEAVGYLLAGSESWACSSYAVVAWCSKNGLPPGVLP